MPICLADLENEKEALEVAKEVIDFLAEKMKAIVGKKRQEHQQQQQQEEQKLLAFREEQGQMVELREQKTKGTAGARAGAATKAASQRTGKALLQAGYHHPCLSMRSSDLRQSPCDH